MTMKVSHYGKVVLVVEDITECPKQIQRVECKPVDVQIPDDPTKEQIVQFLRSRVTPVNANKDVFETILETSGRLVYDHITIDLC